MSGDQHSQRLLAVFLEHRPQLRSLARKVVGTSDAADEVVQDAYVRLAESGGGGLCIDKPYAYCCQVVRNMALDHCRRRSLESKVWVATDDGEMPEIPTHCAMPARVDGRRMIQAVDEVLGKLPPRTRQAFELFRLGEMTQRDIAERLGCSATLVNFMVRDARLAIESLRQRSDLFAT